MQEDREATRANVRNNLRVILFLFYFLFNVFSHKWSLLDLSYNYHANKMYEQVSPIDIYQEEEEEEDLFAVNKQPLYIFVSVSIVIISFT